MNDDEIQPRRFNTGDHVVTPDGRVARIQYLTGYVRDESGESNPTQAILLLPKQVRADNGDRRPHRAKPKRPHVQRTVKPMTMCATSYPSSARRQSQTEREG